MYLGLVFQVGGAVGLAVWCSRMIAAVARVSVSAVRLRVIGVSLMPHGV